jgi:hypothetical protein
MRCARGFLPQWLKMISQANLRLIDDFMDAVEHRICSASMWPSRLPWTPANYFTRYNRRSRQPAHLKRCSNLEVTKTHIAYDFPCSCKFAPPGQLRSGFFHHILVGLGFCRLVSYICSGMLKRKKQLFGHVAVSIQSMRAASGYSVFCRFVVKVVGQVEGER